MAEPLTYRLYRPSDFPDVARLWADEAGWGDVTPEMWRRWFEDTPHGPCLVFVAATAAGEVVGQIVFTPAVVQVGPERVRAMRLSAPIVRAEHRTAGIRSLHHPAITLWLGASIAAAARGFRLVYALPDRTWLPFFRAVGRFQTAEYPCLTLPLAAAPSPAGRWAARPVAALGPEHAAVWAAAREAFPVRCGVERSADWLRYRNGGNVCAEVRDGADGPVAGYVAVNPKNGLLMDVVARSPDELPGVLSAAVAALAERARGGGGLPFDAVKAMTCPAIEPALAATGFALTDFRFGLGVDVLDPDLDPAAVAPELWYSMPAD